VARACGGSEDKGRWFALSGGDQSLLSDGDQGARQRRREGHGVTDDSAFKKQARVRMAETEGKCTGSPTILVGRLTTAGSVKASRVGGRGRGTTNPFWMTVLVLQNGFVFHVAPRRDGAGGSGRAAADQPDGGGDKQHRQCEQPAALDPLERPEPAPWLVLRPVGVAVLGEVLQHGAVG
jgi:hypothetical protein